MDTLQAIQCSTLFAGVSPAQCEAFLPIVHTQCAGEGRSLFRLGDAARVLYIIRSGTVQLTMPFAMYGSVKEVVVQEAREGDTVAWSGLIEPFRFTMSGRAGTDVELIAFSTRELQAAIEAYPEAGVRIVTNLAAVIAKRLQVSHTMWTRELQRAVNVTLCEAATA
jgi:CRP-like cAMP-binding protein